MLAAPARLVLPLLAAPAFATVVLFRRALLVPFAQVAQHHHADARRQAIAALLLATATGAPVAALPLALLLTAVLRSLFAHAFAQRFEPFAHLRPTAAAHLLAAFVQAFADLLDTFAHGLEPRARVAFGARPPLLLGGGEGEEEAEDQD